MKIDVVPLILLLVVFVFGVSTGVSLSIGNLKPELIEAFRLFIMSILMFPFLMFCLVVTIRAFVGKDV